MHLVYFPVAGRGELIRLIAAVGGIEDFQESSTLPDGITSEECGSAGSLPILLDGTNNELKINETVAIEHYVAGTIPVFAENLTPHQRAKDGQFCALKETCLGAVGTPLFGKDIDAVKANVNKFYPLVEGLLPADGGFINGLDHPTVADLAVLNMCVGYMPFGAAFKAAGIDIATQFPKLYAHAEKVKQVEAVANYLEKSKTMSAAAYGL